jgi:5-methylcytosine-specific restriction protein A
MELAVEVATGTPFPRSEFSGGDETNRHLEALGFEIQPKPGLNTSAMTLDGLRPGVTISNDDIGHVFAVGNAGGMRWSSARTCMVIIFDHSKALYDDRWDQNVLHYTGLGTVGDQTLTGQNLRLAKQQETGIDVHLFEVFEQNKYVYAGRVVLAGKVVTEQQLDEENHPRQVFVFPLRLVDGQQPQPTLEQVQKIRRGRQRQLRTKTLEELKALAERGGRRSPGSRNVTANQYERNEAVAEYVKRVAKGICGLCEEKAPFVTSEGPYLESHHVVHLAKSGSDTIENAIALCPNCHRKMHVLDLPEDRAALFARIALRGASAN